MNPINAGVPDKNTESVYALPARRGDDDDQQDIPLGEVFSVVRGNWKRIVGASFLAGALGYGVAWLIPPTFTAKTVILPPQQQQGGAAAALSSLGALGALGGLAGGLSGATPGEKYVAMLQSANVGNRIIDQYNLMEIYKSKFRVDALKDLADNVRISLGKKDGLLTIEVDDEDPGRSAAMANSYVSELRRLGDTLAVTEAQQRRMFFDNQLLQTKEKLALAQVALQESGFTEGVIKAEPKAAADGYAKIRAEITANEVRLQTLRGSLADGAPEIVQLQAALGVLRSKLNSVESSGATSAAKGINADYITRYREFKYQETLFELYAKQLELARMDEAREGALIQVLDVATTPDRKSKPRRGLMALGIAMVAGLLLSTKVVVDHLRHAPNRVRS